MRDLLYYEPCILRIYCKLPRSTWLTRNKSKGCELTDRIPQSAAGWCG